jgi:hypothetical protein
MVSRNVIKKADEAMSASFDLMTRPRVAEDISLTN